MSRSDDEVLVKVEGVSKKFCRSLKKSLWYGVCDIAGELLPGRKRQRVAGSELRVAREEAEVAGSELLVASGNTSAGGGDRAAGASAPVTSYPPLVTSPTGEASLRPGEFFAVKDVSFELRRGECLGLIGHNGAGTQAAGQPRGRLPQAARRERRRGKARINTTLLKMLNGSITMRGRVGALIALGAGFNPILTGREPEGWEAHRKSNRRLARRVQRRREGANQNIFLNGAILGMRKAEPERQGGAENRKAGKAEGRATEGWPEGRGIGGDASHRLPQAGPQGFATWEKRKPNCAEVR